jgi:hypothetical protein
MLPTVNPWREDSLLLWVLVSPTRTSPKNATTKKKESSDVERKHMETESPKGEQNQPKGKTAKKKE